MKSEGLARAPLFDRQLWQSRLQQSWLLRNVLLLLLWLLVFEIGWLVEYTSWHWIFLINLPVGALGCWAAFKLMPDLRGMGLKDALYLIEQMQLKARVRRTREV